jgi:hypothetical protein
VTNAGEMDVYVLQHVHALGDDDEDVKMIGVYSSHASAEAAVERLRRQPGFCDAPDGFCIDRYPFDKDHWAEGYMTVSRGAPWPAAEGPHRSRGPGATERPGHS